MNRNISRAAKSVGIAPAAVLLGLLLCGTASRRVDAQPPAAEEGQEFNALTAALVLEKTFVKVIAEAEESVVSIARIRNVPQRPRKPANFPIPRPRNVDDPTSPDFIPNEFGSGIIIAPFEKSDDRFILTNYHVVKGGPVVKKAADKADSKLYVRLPNRQGFYASILAADPRSDLAILQIDYAALKLKPSDLKPLRFSERNTFRKGQLVLALGNPYAQARDGSASASWGMISNISRRPKPAGKTTALEDRKSETIHHFGTLLQVDTRLNVGTSGGPLLNLKGELIGINTSLAALEGYETSVGYAIPFNADIRRIVQTLAKGLEVEYGYLGISPQDVQPAVLPEGLRRSHAVNAASVHRNSPAERGGIRSFDVVLGVDGQPVHDRYDLMRYVGLKAPGSRVKFRIWRRSVRRRIVLAVHLGKWPVINDEDIIATSRRFPAWRGIRVDYPTARQRFLQLPYRYHEAVVVLDVSNQTLKKSGELQPGDYVSHVNGKSVQTPAEFHAEVRNAKGTVRLNLVGGNTVRVP